MSCPQDAEPQLLEPITALVRVNKQIRHELLPMIFLGKTFVVDVMPCESSSDRLVRWLQRLPQELSRWYGKVRLNFRYDHSQWSHQWRRPIECYILILDRLFWILAKSPIGNKWPHYQLEFTCGERELVAWPYLTQNDHDRESLDIAIGHYVFAERVVNRLLTAYRLPITDNLQEKWIRTALGAIPISVRQSIGEEALNAGLRKTFRDRMSITGYDTESAIQLTQKYVAKSLCDLTLCCEGRSAEGPWQFRSKCWTEPECSRWIFQCELPVNMESSTARHTRAWFRERLQRLLEIPTNLHDRYRDFLDQVYAPDDWELKLFPSSCAW